MERCMCVMQSGTQMVKLKAGSKGLVRLFYLDEHRSCIRWKPSRKSEKAKSEYARIHAETLARTVSLYMYNAHCCTHSHCKCWKRTLAFLECMQGLNKSKHLKHFHAYKCVHMCASCHIIEHNFSLELWQAERSQHKQKNKWEWLILIII